MKITLDTEMGFVSSFLKLVADKDFNALAKSVDKTDEAKKIASKDDVDFHKLLKELKLDKSKNRFLILMMMNNGDLLKLLQKLGKKQLLMGLKFFSEAKLLSMIWRLPKKEILKILLELIPMKKLIEMMPEREIHRFFKSSQIKAEDLRNSLASMPPYVLSQIIESATGMSMNGQQSSKADMMKIINGMDKDSLLEGMGSLKRKHLNGIVLNLVNKKPELMLEFSKEALFKPLEKIEKPDLIKSMGVLKEDMLVKMLEELPKELLAITLTMVDPTEFADVLLSDHSDLLYQIALA